MISIYVTSSGKIVLGGTFLHNHMAYFAIDDKKVGFAQANCLNITDYQPPKYNETELNKTKQIIQKLDQNNWRIIYFAIGAIIFCVMLIMLIIICKKKCKTKIVDDPRRVSNPDSIEIEV